MLKILILAAGFHGQRVNAAMNALVMWKLLLPAVTQ
jgi:hypothetical protein